MKSFLDDIVFIASSFVALLSAVLFLRSLFAVGRAGKQGVRPQEGRMEKPLRARRRFLILMLISGGMALFALPRSFLAPSLPRRAMTTIGAFSEEISSLADRAPTALIFTESIGAPSTFTVTVDDPAVVREALQTILRTPVSRRGCQVDMMQLQDETYCFVFGEDTYTFSFLPHSYFCYGGQDYELGANELDRLCSRLHAMAEQAQAPVEPKSKGYGEDAVLETRLIDNGDEARSITELTLTWEGKTLTGFIEGAYDVLSVERQPDGYVITYTYGDFYRHDTVRSCRLTVENGKLIISDLVQ